jgi:uncharacterized protein with NAD-binding domain and iron-sulfur cluster
LAVAYWLTATAELQQRYSVTVYTRGWRLGGKGASARNNAKADRLEEHGIHIWMGMSQAIGPCRASMAAASKAPSNPGCAHRR